MAKNIVICCDGTGNEIEDNQSNVLKLYRVLEKSASQRVYYDPGIGTMGASNDWGRLKQNAGAIFGLATGYGLDQNLLDAYRYLATHYRRDDAIFMFGYSRGAYTVRALAGFVNTIGLLSADQLHLADYALTAYKRISEDGQFTDSRLFNQALRPTRPPIKFLGLWDTVSTVIVPRKDRMFLPSLRRLAYTQENPSVEMVRHALAIDERRRMFRPYLWKADEEYWGGPFPPNHPKPQDVKQVWFTGVHSDVGGGNPESESGLAKLTLQWMLDEAPAELRVRTQSKNQIVLGKPRKNSKHVYSTPDFSAEMHDSMKGAWPALEWLPKRVRRREWRDRGSLLGWYLPRSEPRLIADGATIHGSVEQRIDDENVDYAPVNLPDDKVFV